MKELRQLESTMNETGNDDDAMSQASSSSASSSGIEKMNNDNSSSSLRSSTNKGEATQTSESSTFAKEETRAVNRSKLLVLAVLSIAAIGVGIATYMFARQSEIKEFENKVREILCTCVFSPPPRETIGTDTHSERISTPNRTDYGLRLVIVPRSQIVAVSNCRPFATKSAEPTMTPRSLMARAVLHRPKITDGSCRSVITPLRQT